MFHYIFREILRILRKNLDLWPLYPADENVPGVFVPNISLSDWMWRLFIIQFVVGSQQYATTLLEFPSYSDMIHLFQISISWKVKDKLIWKQTGSDTSFQSDKWDRGPAASVRLTLDINNYHWYRPSLPHSTTPPLSLSIYNHCWSSQVSSQTRLRATQHSDLTDQTALLCGWTSFVRSWSHWLNINY